MLGRTNARTASLCSRSSIAWPIPLAERPTRRARYGISRNSGAATDSASVASDRQVAVRIDQYLGIEGKQSQSQQLRYHAGSQHDFTLAGMLPAAWRRRVERNLIASGLASADTAALDRAIGYAPGGRCARESANASRRAP